MIFEYVDTMSADIGGIAISATLCKIGVTPICGGSSHETVSGCVT